MNKSLIRLCFILMLVSCANSHAEQDYHAILIEADHARGNYEGITWKVNVQARDKHKEYFVQAAGFDLLAETVSPSRYKGNKILMVSGNMWFYKPGLSKPVPISRRQKLLGEASYGDISSTNYAFDYSIEQVNDDTIDGELCWLFELKSSTKENTYDRIRYWVSKERKVGLKAEYFTVSGKRIKTAFMAYENSVNKQGIELPFLSKITISDDIYSGQQTVLDLSEPNLKKIPDYYFNVNFLRK